MPPRERAAIRAAIEKLEALGDRLGHPHSSAVRGSITTLRELRPRGGGSPWRLFYRRIGRRMVVAGVGPEAVSDRRGFERAVATAQARLDDESRLLELGL